MLARTRWITFDCFGTLVDWRAGFTSVLRPFVGDKAVDVLRAYDVHERTVASGRPHRSYKDVLVAALLRACEEQGVTLSRVEARVLLQAWSSLPLFDDVEAMLAELRAHGWRLGVLANCDEDLFAITHRQFRRPFDFVLTAERIRGYKPAPWHFRGFERLTRVSRGNWVHVAGSVYHDIAPAHTLGIQHVWLDRERTGKTAVTPAHVYSAADVPRAVEWLVESQQEPACC